MEDPVSGGAADHLRRRAARPDLHPDQLVGVEFLINFGGLGQLINDLAERYDLPGTYAAICFVILVSVCFFVVTEWIERWLQAGSTDLPASVRASSSHPVTVAAHRDCRARVADLGGRRRVRGLLYRDVVPSLLAIGRRLVKLLVDPEFYWHLRVTGGGDGAALAIGGVAGLLVGAGARRQPLAVEMPLSPTSTISARRRRSSSSRS